MNTDNATTNDTGTAPETASQQAAPTEAVTASTQAQSGFKIRPPTPREYIERMGKPGVLTPAHHMVALSLYPEGGEGSVFSMSTETPRAAGTVWIGPEYDPRAEAPMTEEVLRLLTTAQPLRFVPARKAEKDARAMPPMIHNDHEVVVQCTTCLSTPGEAMVRRKRDLAEEGKAIVFDAAFIKAAFGGKSRREARSWCPLCQSATMKTSRAAVSAAGADIPETVVATMTREFNRAVATPDGAVLPRMYGVVLQAEGAPAPIVAETPKADWVRINLAIRTANLEKARGRIGHLVPASELRGVAIQVNRWCISTPVDLDTGRPGVAVGWVTKGALLGAASTGAGMKMRLLGGAPMASLAVRDVL